MKTRWNDVKEETKSFVSSQ